MVSDRVYLGQCLAKMHMAPELVEQIPAVLRGEASFAPVPIVTAPGEQKISAVVRGVRAVYGRALATPALPENADENREAPSGDRPTS